tara:strand:- start:3889 stop:4092 length:204 start_codon:yes stop_codon:yes gene_type:complete
MDNIKNMFKNAFDSNASEFEKDFSAIMSAKMNSAIEAKYDNMFGSNNAEPQIDTEPKTELETTETEA